MGSVSTDHCLSSCEKCCKTVRGGGRVESLYGCKCSLDISSVLCRVRQPYSDYGGTKTVRYSKVYHSDQVSWAGSDEGLTLLCVLRFVSLQSEDEKASSPRKKLKLGKGYAPVGKGHDASPRYSPASSTVW